MRIALNQCRRQLIGVADAVSADKGGGWLVRCNTESQPAMKNLQQVDLTRDNGMIGSP